MGFVISLFLFLKEEYNRKNFPLPENISAKQFHVLVSEPSAFSLLWQRLVANETWSTRHTGCTRRGHIHWGSDTAAVTVEAGGRPSCPRARPWQCLVLGAVS